MATMNHSVSDSNHILISNQKSMSIQLTYYDSYDSFFAFGIGFDNLALLNISLDHTQKTALLLTYCQTPEATHENQQIKT